MYFLWKKLETVPGHNFAIFGFSLTSGGRYVISVSNKFLTWDLASSEVCRDVDPGCEGLMLGLAVSPDYRQAAAFTSINQIVLLDVMLGQVISTVPSSFITAGRYK